MKPRRLTGIRASAQPRAIEDRLGGEKRSSNGLPSGAFTGSADGSADVRGKPGASTTHVRAAFT